MQKHEKFIDFNVLRIFTVVAQTETLTLAAEKLGVTQSAVSQALKQLESQLGIRLVVRRSRPTALTASGQVLLTHANQLLAANQQMLIAVRKAAEQGPRQLRLGLIDSLADAAGQQIMQQLMPLADQLTMRTGLLGSLKEALLERQIDILLTSDPMTDHPELEMLPLLRDPFVVLVSKLKMPSSTCSVAELAHTLPFIAYSRQLRLGGLTQLIARRIGVELQPRFELDSTVTLLRFVQNGYGWAFVPASCLLQNSSLIEGVNILPIEPGSHARYICLLSRKDEFGDLPSQVAQICRDIYTDHLVPKLPEMWLQKEAYAVNELPLH